MEITQGVYAIMHGARILLQIPLGEIDAPRILNLTIHPYPISRRETVLRNDNWFVIAFVEELRTVVERFRCDRPIERRVRIANRMFVERKTMRGVCVGRYGRPLINIYSEKIERRADDLHVTGPYLRGICAKEFQTLFRVSAQVNRIHPPTIVPAIS